MTPGYHQCPVGPCSAEVPRRLLMCKEDWRRVAAPIRAAVWTSWRNGKGAGTPEHAAAMDAAITSAEAARLDAEPAGGAGS